MVDLKAAYTENGNLYRFFLSWRDRSFVGYFAIVAALVLVYPWVRNNMPYFAIALPIIGLFMTIVFRRLELSVRDLYVNCINVGSDIEKRSGLPEQSAIYRQLKQEPLGSIELKALFQ